MDRWVEETHEWLGRASGELLEGLDTQLQKTSGRPQSSTLEVYHRLSLALRVRRGEQRGDDLRVGREEGVAVRVAHSADRTVRFAASSGTLESGLPRALGRALESPGVTATSVPWSTQEVTRDDCDAELRLPAPAELAAWLDRAGETMSPLTGSAPASWVEVAATLESWGASEGGRSSRLRTRAWAGCRPPVGGEGPSATLFLAARRWSALPDDGWARLLRERAVPEGPAVRPPEGIPVVFGPETASMLVPAVAAGLHRPPLVERRVGPGWSLVDRPADPDGPQGSGHDDAGFETSERRLADGMGTLAAIEGPGTLRRASFRDPPEHTPTTLVVDASPVASPSRALQVTGLEIHPLGDGHLALEIAGRLGPEGPRLRRSRVRITPGELARRCVGGTGPARLSHRGVRTSALVFEELPWSE